MDMKKYKYVALFTVLAMALFITTSVRAEDGSGVSGNSDTKVDTSLKIDGSLPSGQDSANDNTEKDREEMKSKIETMRQEAKIKMEALKKSIKSEKDNAKAKIKENRIIGREKVLTRFDEVVKNLSAIEVRVNAQISNLDAKGIYTTSAKASVAAADTNLADINTKIAAANTLLAKSASELTAEDKTNLKTLAGDIQTLAKSARQALSDAVKSLKASIINKK